MFTHDITVGDEIGYGWMREYVQTISIQMTEWQLDSFF